MLPIPKNLFPILVPKGSGNHAFQCHGELVCTCGHNSFDVRLVGEEVGKRKDKTIKVAKMNGHYFFIVKVKCHNCGKIHLIFDKDYHGWNGFVCKGFGGRKNPRPMDRSWACPECAHTAYKVQLSLFSKGKQDFISETEGEFDENDWREGYSWIIIGLACQSCEWENEEWVSYETM